MDPRTAPAGRAPSIWLRGADGFELKSSAFEDGEELPAEYLAGDDGDNVSPPLSLVNPPQGAETFALIVDNPDAPKDSSSHWIVYNIPKEKTELEEEVSSASDSKVSKVLTTKPPPPSRRRLDQAAWEGWRDGTCGVDMGGMGMGGMGGMPELPDSAYTIAAEGVASAAGKKRATSWIGPYRKPG